MGKMQFTTTATLHGKTTRSREQSAYVKHEMSPADATTETLAMIASCVTCHSDVHSRCIMPAQGDEPVEGGPLLAAEQPSPS